MVPIVPWLYLIWSWCDLFHDWYGIIIARTVVLTNLITNFQKLALQFICNTLSVVWWFLRALMADVHQEAEPIFINHIGQWNICICLLSMPGWWYYINMGLEGPCDARWRVTDFYSPTDKNKVQLKENNNNLHQNLKQGLKWVHTWNILPYFPLTEFEYCPKK